MSELEEFKKRFARYLLSVWERDDSRYSSRGEALRANVGEASDAFELFLEEALREIDDDVEKGASRKDFRVKWGLERASLFRDGDVSDSSVPVEDVEPEQGFGGGNVPFWELVR